MISAPKGRRFAVLALVAATAALAGSAPPALARKKPAAVVAPAPPPIPGVSLSPTVIQMAGAYRAYMSRASAISPAFTGGEDVAAGLKVGEAYEPRQLLRGAIAYGAVAALQAPDFVAGVRVYVADPVQRREVAYAIMKDPAYALGFAGAASAAGLAAKAIGDDGNRLLAQGRKVKQAAYDVQHSAWSKTTVASPEARLAAAKQLSSVPAPADEGETARLGQAVQGAAPMGIVAASAPPPYAQAVVRSLAVAALAALGYADDASLEQVMPILADSTAGACLNMAKLNLYQCLAVSRPHYEDVFCLGQHIMMDTGMCMMNAAGLPTPDDLKPKMAVLKPEPVAKPKPVRRKKAAKK